MQGNPKDGSTGEREAYFIDFAREIARVAKMPIMVTGGITKLEVAEEAIKKDQAGYGVQLWVLDELWQVTLTYLITGGSARIKM